METINQLRKRIDEVDNQILNLFSERAKLCESIGLLKKEKRLPVRAPSRENEVFMKVREKAAKLGLVPSKVEAIYLLIVNMCSSVQEEKVTW